MMSKHFSRNHFGWRCDITMLFALQFSKKPLIYLDLIKASVTAEQAITFGDLIRVDAGRIGVLKIAFDTTIERPTRAFHTLFEEIGRSELSEVSFRCNDEALYAHI
jgi:hypothetical protein